MRDWLLFLERVRTLMVIGKIGLVEIPWVN